MAAAEVAVALLVTYLHRRAEPAERGGDVGAQPLDVAAVDADEGRLRAELLRLAQRLPWRDPARGSRRRCGEHGKAQLGRASDDHRLPAQLGMAAQRRHQPEVGMARAEQPPRPLRH